MTEDNLDVFFALFGVKLFPYQKTILTSKFMRYGRMNQRIMIEDEQND